MATPGQLTFIYLPVVGFLVPFCDGCEFYKMISSGKNFMKITSVGMGAAKSDETR